jgi:hypothetical protein
MLGQTLLGIVTQMTVAYLLSFPLLFFIQVDPYYKRLLRMSIVACNTGDIPTTLMTSIGVSPLLSPSGQVIDPAIQVEEGIGYIQIASTWAIFMYWSVVWFYVQVPTDFAPKPDGALPPALNQPLLSSPLPPDQRKASAIRESLLGDEHELTYTRTPLAATRQSESERRPTLQSIKSARVLHSSHVDPRLSQLTEKSRRFLVTPQEPSMLVTSADIRPPEGSLAATEALLMSNPDTENRLLVLRQALLMIFTSPPVIAAIIGLFVAFVTPLNDLLVAPGAPLEVVMTTIKTVRDAYVAVIWLVVGAKIGRGARQLKTISFSDSSAYPFFIVAFARLLIVPFVYSYVITAFTQIGIISPNIMLQFVVRLNAITPTASTLLLILELIDAPFTTEIVVLFILEYLIMLVTLPLMCSLSLIYVAEMY